MLKSKYLKKSSINYLKHLSNFNTEDISLNFHINMLKKLINFTFLKKLKNIVIKVKL